MFFLVTGDRRQALETAGHDDEAWTARLRLCLHARRRVGPDGSRLNTGAWVSNAGPPDAAIDIDWIGQALTEMAAEQRASVVFPALFEDGEDRLAGLFGCSPAQASARRRQAMLRLRATVSEADTDHVDTCAPVLSDTALAVALADVADRGLVNAVERATARRSRAWILRAVMLIIVALVLAPGLSQMAHPPLGVAWQSFGEIEFADGRLRRIGRGNVTEAAWSPDGARIVVAASSGIYALDAATLRPIGYAAARAGTRLIGLSPDGSQIATWLDDALVLRDGVDLRPVFTAASNEWLGVSAVAWDWTSETLALGGTQGVALLKPRETSRSTLFPAAAGAARLRFSPDGAWLAITTATPETLLIRTDGASMFEIGGNSHPAIASDFSGDGRSLIGVFGHGVAVADLEAGSWKTKADRSGLTTFLWVSQDGKRAVVVDGAAIADAADLLTIDLETGQVTRRLRVPRYLHVGAMAVREDGAHALIVNADGLSIWDLNTGALVAASVDFAPPPGVILPTPVRFSDDGRHLVALDAYGGLRVMDATSGRIERALNENTDPFIDAVFSPDGRQLVADNDAGVGLRRLAPGDRSRQTEPALYGFDVASGRVTHVFPGARQPQFIAPSVMAYLPVERNELRSYNFSTATNQAWASVQAARIDAFAASVGPTRVAVLTDRTLELWDPGSGLVWRSPIALSEVDRVLLGRPLAISGDARLIAVAEPSLGIRIYAGDTGALRGVLAKPITVTFEASLENPLKAAISPDGRWIATVDNRPTLANTASSIMTVWRADTLRPSETRADDRERVTGIAFSPDSRRLVTMRSNYVIELIELP